MDLHRPGIAPDAGELLFTSALLSLYVSLRSGAWAVGRVERAVGSSRAPRPSRRRG